jgi:hypothetical protein
MGKYLYRDLTPELSAVVSTHGYFEIQKRETYNSYASGIGPVYHHQTKERIPDPVVVYEGSVADLGITYGPDDDIHFEGDETEDDGYEVVRQRLLAYLAGKGET